MTHRPLNPLMASHIAIDANALDRDGSDHDRLVDRLRGLVSAGKLGLIVPKGARLEVQNPRTPAHVQEAILPQIFTLPVGLNSDEERRHRIIKEKLRGNAKSGKHEADADHLFEAAKYGGYFITRDRRIMKRAGRLCDVLPPTLTVVTLKDFLAIYNEYEARAAAEAESPS
jgi:hypothetical protein